MTPVANTGANPFYLFKNLGQGIKTANLGQHFVFWGALAVAALLAIITTVAVTSCVNTKCCSSLALCCDDKAKVV